MEKLTDSEKKEIIAALRGATEIALKQMKLQEMFSGKSNMAKFNLFDATVKQALRETEEEYMGEGDCDCESCTLKDECGAFVGKGEAPEGIKINLNARLVLMADVAAKEEGETLSQWLTNLIAKELFY